MRVPAGNIDYPLFVYSGLVPWMYFTHVLTKSSMSLINTGLLSKAYFPRLLLPLAAAIGGLLDLCVTSAVLAGLMIYYGALPSATVVLVPAALLLAAVVAFGVGVWVAVLNLFHRDVAHALPFSTQLLFFITPVAYPITVVPPAWLPLYSLNPMVAVVECWRWTLFGTPVPLSWTQLASSLGVAAAVILSGLWYFARHAPTLADVGEM
jgi:lipopolysaccharide transport system permease protein